MCTTSHCFASDHLAAKLLFCRAKRSFPRVPRRDLELLSTIEPCEHGTDGSRWEHPVEAYLLIQSAPGRIKNALRALESIAEIVECEVVEGPFDVIARTVVPDRRSLVRIVGELPLAYADVLRVLPCVVSSG